MDLKNVFTHHAPFGTQVARYELIRAKARELAELVVELTPFSREQSVAVTNIQQAVMWANAAIAINEQPKEPATVRQHVYDAIKD